MPPLSDDAMKQLWDWNFTNHKPTPDAIKKMEGLRSAAKAMKDAIIDMVPRSREQSLSLTNLETMLFYANAGIARNESEDGKIPETPPQAPVNIPVREDKPPLESPAERTSKITNDFTHKGKRYQRTLIESSDPNAEATEILTADGQEIPDEDFHTAQAAAKKIGE